MNTAPSATKLPSLVPPAKVDIAAGDRRWIAEAPETGQLTLGKSGKMFAEKFAALCRTKHAVAINSGTAALEMGGRTRPARRVVGPAAFRRTERRRVKPCPHNGI